MVKAFVNNKKSDNLLTYTTEFCLLKNFPSEFSSDNGVVFKNVN